MAFGRRHNAGPEDAIPSADLPGRPAALIANNPFRRVQFGLAALALVVVAGTLGYTALGFGLVEALYQTVVTVSTVGYGFPHPIGTGVKAFTVVLILLGVGTALYTFTVTLELLIDGHMRELIRRRGMERDVAKMEGHVVICGWGRVGREVARFLSNAGEQIVVVDRDPDRIATLDFPTIVGDVTDDATLLHAGITRAGTLIAALDTDADNLFVTVASRSFNPGIHVIARARRVGADRVVNPQRLGGDRMAAFVTQPHVVDFVDVVMHDGSLEFRLEELAVGPHSPLAGETLRSSQVHERTGCLVLALRRPDGTFTPNPSPDAEVAAGDVLIGVGTASQLAALMDYAARD
jgi:voltage-gated potassium channel